MAVGEIIPVGIVQVARFSEFLHGSVAVAITGIQGSHTVEQGAATLFAPPAPGDAIEGFTHGFVLPAFASVGSTIGWRIRQQCSRIPILLFTPRIIWIWVQMAGFTRFRYGILARISGIRILIPASGITVFTHRSLCVRFRHI